ncbi:18745_t:CDS:2 [Funneliformis geosporum]|uniref:5578_t:CDS:1 n=1 Tax=Funneliformis geosporum TaxID=1117311 RepID=A0A9W4SJ86_9GLOM|nr:18745_t:CDS:2 [Funneliformis geosporum]CAI2171892.1 5578_t:CDS:2 [Funneliformis geosporum]
MPPKNYRYKKATFTRGGGHKFTNPRRLAAAKQAEEEEGMWGNREKKEEDSSEEGSDEESEDSGEPKKSGEQKERSKNNPNRTKKDNLKASDITNAPREMTRKEREAAEKEAARQRYWKLHLEGKTDQAKSDLARLAVIKKQREEAALQRKAEQEARAEAQKTKIASQGRKTKK